MKLQVVQALYREYWLLLNGLLNEKVFLRCRICCKYKHNTKKKTHTNILFMNWKFWKSSGRKSKTREWVDALIFAVIAATIIRTFLIEAFTIPTPSMEKSLLVGDFLFVSKVSYGARIPMTPLSFPFAHHTMPVIGGKSYLEWIKFGYHRLPGFGKVNRGDCVVFNWPAEALGRPIDKKENYIKRCMGTPGDTISILKREVYINSK